MVQLPANRMASHIIRQQILVERRDRQNMIVQHLDVAHPGHFNSWRRWEIRFKAFEHWLLLHAKLIPESALQSWRDLPTNKVLCNIFTE
eukprot:13689727-Heterocapsa_arctica.AAC.1